MEQHGPCYLVGSDLIDAKKRQEQIQPADEAPTATNVSDLLEALRARLDARQEPASQQAANPNGRLFRRTLLDHYCFAGLRAAKR